MSSCSICGKQLEVTESFLKTDPPKGICEKCNYEKYLAKTGKDLESRRAYFNQFIYGMTEDVAKALDEEAPALGIVQEVLSEIEKVEFANSFDEHYEYDIVTVINKNHGTIDKGHMLNVLREHASQGWRLHTVYSNELGKNAVMLLGLGVNATACEDVLIFERRLRNVAD